MLIQIALIILLVILAGIFAGLTLALFSLKLNTLETKVRMGDQRAAKVYRLRKTGNLLLCTLLLGNVGSYTAMTIFLDNLTPGLTAGLTATALIFVFGEIIPQAVFPRFALKVGAALNWFVWFFLILFYPVSGPIAWFLDKMLGKETPVLWSKEELGEIIRYHEDIGDGIIDKDEERIILGALSFSDKQVRAIMIPIEKVYIIQVDQRIDKYLLSEIKKKGFSRIPVVNRSGHALGLLYVKDLIGLEGGITVRDCFRDRDTLKVAAHMKLDKLLDLLISGNMQMALVVDSSDKLLGVITLEDIMEEILRKEIDVIH